nr:Holliday junction resolvase RecU [Neobacillus endophyticus]
MVYYPKGTGSNASSKEGICYSNRGMGLEDILNRTNSYYNEVAKCAVIHKKPTPIQIVKVEYPKRSAATIREAYFKQSSYSDYTGIFKGKHIDFEAKETRNKTSIPLSNFHQNQIDHMRQVLKHQGICFALVRFVTTDECFLLDAAYILLFWDDQKYGGRKSIPKPFFEEKGFAIPYSNQPELDYLKVVNEHYF